MAITHYRTNYALRASDVALMQENMAQLILRMAPRFTEWDALERSAQERAWTPYTRGDEDPSLLYFSHEGSMTAVFADAGTEAALRGLPGVQILGRGRWRPLGQQSECWEFTAEEEEEAP